MTPYERIQLYYGNKRAVRSGVPYMQHIDEGLKVLDALGATMYQQEAFCLHPIFQTDEDLRSNWQELYKFDDVSIEYVMEYRRRDNAWMPDRIVRLPDGSCHTPTPQPVISNLKGVNNMLLADKLQNYKDFYTYHSGRHPQSTELTWYFQSWLAALDVHNVLPNWRTLLGTNLPDFDPRHVAMGY